MNTENRTYNQIVKKLRDHNLISATYVAFFCGVIIIEYPFSDNPRNGLPNLVFKIILLIVFVSVDIYLINMGLKTQQLLRRIGHTKGYLGEYLIVILYMLWICHYVRFHILIPSVTYLVANQEYECTKTIVRLIQITGEIDLLINPTVFQIIFVGLMLQLISLTSKIKQEERSEKPYEVSTQYDMSNVDGFQFGVDLSGESDAAEPVLPQSPRTMLIHRVLDT